MVTKWQYLIFNLGKSHEYMNKNSRFVGNERFIVIDMQIYFLLLYDTSCTFYIKKKNRIKYSYIKQFSLFSLIIYFLILFISVLRHSYNYNSCIF